MSSTYSIDDERMIRLQAGDSAAFNELVSDWQGPLFGFFLKNTRDVHLSEDLVQETLLRLHKNSWDYLPKGLFRGFLFRIGPLVLCLARRPSILQIIKEAHSYVLRIFLEL